MKLINNLKTGVKLMGGFLLVAALLLVVAIVGYTGMKTINDNMTHLYFDRTLPIHDVGIAEAELFRLRGEVYKYIMIPDNRAAIRLSMDEAVQEINNRIEKYRATNLVQEEMDAMAVFDLEWGHYRAAVDAAIAEVDSGNEQVAITSIADGGEVAEQRKEVGAAMEEIIDVNMSIAEELNADGDATFAASLRLLLIVSAVAVLLAVGLGWAITISTNQPLQIMSNALTNLAAGDLNRDIPQQVKDQMVKRDDEIGTAGKGLVQVEQYMMEMAEAAREIANGDLTVEIQEKSSKDELGLAFKQMVKDLRWQVGQVAENANSLSVASAQLAEASNQVGQVAENANSLSVASAQLAEASNQAGQATNQISITVQQVAKGTAQQSESVTATAASTEQLGRAIDGVAKGAQEQSHAVEKASTVTSQITSALQQVAGNADKVMQGSAGATETARKGAKIVEDTIRGMQSIKEKVGLSSNKVEEMGKRSDQIGAIVETIEDIASQTNLLALNAAIEAARAGEHGKGFAVVADEVRKLAERASAATKEIGGLIKGIQATVTEAVAAMGEGAQEVEVGVGRANQAGGALAEILDASEGVYAQAEQAAQAARQMNEAANELVNSVDAVSAVVEENTASTEEMAASSAEVTQAIENIASVSEENGAAIEQVSASTEEMTAQVEEVSAAAQSLAEMAHALQQVVKQFKLSQDGQTSRGGNGKATLPEMELHPAQEHGASERGNGAKVKHLAV